GPSSRRPIVASDVGEEALLVVVEDDFSVSMVELFRAMAAGGEPVDDALAAWVVDAAARLAIAAQTDSLTDIRIPVSDGQPLLCPGAPLSRSTNGTNAILDALPPGIADFDRTLAPLDALERLKARAAVDDAAADARARLKGLVEAWFPSRIRAHADFLEQAA